MVGILIVLQVSVQPVTVTLLGLAKKDPYKNSGESGQRETWRLHKAESQTRNNTLKISNSQQRGGRPGAVRPRTCCLSVGSRTSVTIQEGG